MTRAVSPQVVVSAVFVAVMFMNIMDSTVVIVALPTLARSFGVPTGSVSGVVTAYLVTLAVAMPVSGWLGDRFGGRAVLLAAITVFTGASALCGLATSLPELVVFRALQGLGGGTLIPVGTTMITRAFLPAERIRANRVLAGPTLLAPALGPVIGGALVDGLSWRWIFYVNLPVGVAALLIGLLLLPRGSQEQAGRFDRPGFLLAAAGFPLLLYALSVGASAGWGSAGVLAPGLAGVVLLAAFVVVEQRVPAPLLRLRLYQNRLFRATTLQQAIASGGFNGTLFLAPLLLQTGLGFSAVHSGLSTFTEAVGGITGIQLTSRLYRRTGPRRLMVAGMTGATTVIGLMALAGRPDAFWLIPLLMYFNGFSFGFAFSPAQTANMATITAAETSHASTLQNTLRQAGSAAGVALLGTVLAATGAGARDLAGYHLAFLAAAGLMALALVCSCFVSDADAAPTMAPRVSVDSLAMNAPEASLPAPAPAPRGQLFRYQGFTADAERGLLTCRYSLDGRDFAERVTLAPGPGWDTPAAQAAARIVYLLAGVSYYKTAAPPVIDLGDTALTARELAFLREFYLAGLGEYAYRNGLDLSDLRFEATIVPDPDPAPASAEPAPAEPAAASSASSAASAGPGGGPAPATGLRPLIPFGGGIDSIVTVEGIREHTADIALFVVSRPGDRYAAIERPAAVSGLPVIRAGREIDSQLLRSAELGFRNGHVPVTGIISAIAVLAAVLSGRDTVVMSNEWSASVPTLERDGVPVNHQWSKSAAFEASFRDLLAAEPAQARLPGYFSALRDRTELWVAERFARLVQYHATFRSCNRAFYVDPGKRLDHWCGHCDKCCFIDLILAPYLPAAQLRAVFAADGGGGEPLDNPELRPKFETLLGSGTKPFECVGEVNECRAALVLAARRPDRAGTALLQQLAAEVTGRPDVPSATEIEDMGRPVGHSFAPARYALGPA